MFLRKFESMEKNHIKKMEEGRTAKQEARTRIKFDNIVIKSYEDGWMLNIGCEDTRYYSDLSGLLKRLFSVKLSRKRIDTLQAIEQVQIHCLREVVEIACRLEEAINNKK